MSAPWISAAVAIRPIGQSLLRSVERVAEDILRDLFSDVLDWPLEDVVVQVGRADLTLSSLGVKHVVVEVKRPGSLRWDRRGVAAALDQARRYADEQRVKAVAVSDGDMLYAADLVGGGFRDRVFVDLASSQPPAALWWVSLHGIYRPCPPLEPAARLPDARSAVDGQAAVDDIELLHGKYHIPARCFAYVGAAGDPKTWKLPYLLADGQPDSARLPGALGSILRDYRGRKVSLPRAAIPDVLVRLGRAAKQLGKLPCQNDATSPTYRDAHDALAQFERLGDVGCCLPS